MQKAYEVVIIGGGASGLVSCVELVTGKNAFLGKDVLLLEKCDRLAKKLAVTGNGQGNLTNEFLSKDNFHGDKSFIEIFLNQINSVGLIDYLSNKGIPTFTDARGRIYPLSKQASAVSDVLRKIIADKGVEVRLNFVVDKVEKNGEFFSIGSKGEVFYAKRVVFATGGKCAKHFGTDGTAYALLKDFGHVTGKLYPSLVQLKAEKSCIKGLSGIKETAIVRAKDGDKVLKSAKGDILFTDFGVSGSTVFEVSGYLTNAEKPSLSVEFLPDVSANELFKILTLKYENDGDYSQIFNCVLNKKLGQKILSETKSTDVKTLCGRVKDYKIAITGTLGFDYAQVTKGGFELSKINANTYESKLVKNLYVIGEALDVDGDCGGYNLTFAFISGIISARSVKNF